MTRTLDADHGRIRPGIEASRQSSCRTAVRRGNLCGAPRTLISEPRESLRDTSKVDPLRLRGRSGLDPAMCAPAKARPATHGKADAVRGVMDIESCRINRSEEGRAYLQQINGKKAFSRGYPGPALRGVYGDLWRRQLHRLPAIDGDICGLSNIQIIYNIYKFIIRCAVSAEETASFGRADGIVS